MRADLHVHTTSSDGSLSPAEVVRRAKNKGLDAIAVTDHDTVNGLDEAICEAEKTGVKLVRGIELSSFSNCEIHVLGYNFDYKNPDFVQELRNVKDMRINRNLLIGQKLNDLGIKPDIDFAADDLGRMNIARQLVKEGYCKDVSSAFEKYLGTGGKAYCNTKRLTPKEAVLFIKKYGGFAAVAHPKKYLTDKRLEMLLSGLKPLGLDGLEVNYPGHGAKDIKELNALCAKYRLLPTGGSDFHDEDKEFDSLLNEKTAKALGLV